MSALELKIPPPVVALLIGGATAFAGNMEFRRAKTTINPFRPQNTTALVTSGVYRFTRNPMYLGLTLLLLGWAMFLCSACALVGPVLFALYVNCFQIKPEEKILSAKFGAAYSEYVSRVRRWL